MAIAPERRSMMSMHRFRIRTESVSVVGMSRVKISTMTGNADDGWEGAHNHINMYDAPPCFESVQHGHMRTGPCTTVHIE